MAETIVNYAGKRQLTMASYEGKTELVDNLDYDIIDYPVDGITNEQMTFALTCKRLFPAGSTFICKDAGTYKAGHTYQIKVSGETKSWEDISDIIKYTAGTNITISDTNVISAKVPTKTSELTNDSEFINTATLNSELTKKQNNLTEEQMLAVNSGITTEKVTDIATNKSDIATLETSKQDKLSDSQLLAINSGATEDKINQIGLNTTAIENKQDKLTETQLTAVNSGITDTKVAQISTNATNITALQEQIGNIDTLLTQLDSGSGV